MINGTVRIIWEEQKGSKSHLYGGVDSTFSGVLNTLAALGKKPEDFNRLIVGAKVTPHLSTSSILWCSGYEVGILFQGLRERGLCTDIPAR